MKKFWRYAGVLVLIIVIGLLIYQFSNNLLGNDQLALYYTAVGTLALAFATIVLALFTGLSIYSGEQREKRRREEELARENRERKERLLNEIIEWAKSSYKLFYDMQKASFILTIFPNTNENNKDLEKSLTLIWGQKDAMVILAKLIDSNLPDTSPWLIEDKLADLVERVKNRLDSYWKEKSSWTPEIIKVKENELENSFAILFKKTAETKAILTTSKK